MSPRLGRSAAAVRRARAWNDTGHKVAERWAVIRQHPHAIWWAFASLHGTVMLALTPLMVAGDVTGDLPLYRSWASGALADGRWPVLDYDWVYPAGALGPIVLSNILGESLYQFVWLLLLTAANAGGLWLLTDRGRKTVDATAAWWWLLILFLLAPVGFLRLEGFSAPMIVAALLLLATRPRIAGVLLAVATWIKVWPAAVIAAAVAASRRRGTIVGAGVATSAAIVGLVVVGGGASHLDSFITMQSSRGLQLEAPMSMPWVWLSMLGVPGSSVYENVGLATNEVMGPGDAWLINGSTGLMLGVLIVLALLTAVAARGLPGARRGARAVDETGVVLLGALALTTTFVTLNKVGSPQYVLWIAPVVAVGLALRPEQFRVPSILVAWTAGLTTLVFPILYLALLDLNPFAVVVLTVRNALLVVLFGWCALRVLSEALSAVGLTRRSPVVEPVGAGLRSLR
ncbi:hypothetical protein ASF17_13275 [Frigoribacterium sp. Leaf263]|uniref:glycosyltransferase 87 family protein n=1 Tax=Frigoribacterium sp. Leaf263 TaxID=1736313 RepID=UPI0006FB7F87|nr:glycosyltransferase 87 family protein [Frigoribacterium sp. Leaf263]KQO81088.1 hypothetical protein ASF17_13275 [Frigoribacterium sp. Leaf263]